MENGEFKIVPFKHKPEEDVFIPKKYRTKRRKRK